MKSRKNVNARRAQERSKRYASKAQSMAERFKRNVKRHY